MSFSDFFDKLASGKDEFLRDITEPIEPKKPMISLPRDKATDEPVSRRSSIFSGISIFANPGDQQPISKDTTEHEMKRRKNEGNEKATTDRVVQTYGETVLDKQDDKSPEMPFEIQNLLQSITESNLTRHNPNTTPDILRDTSNSNTNDSKRYDRKTHTKKQDMHNTEPTQKVYPKEGSCKRKSPIYSESTLEDDSSNSRSEIRRSDRIKAKIGNSPPPKQQPNKQPNKQTNKSANPISTQPKQAVKKPAHKQVKSQQQIQNVQIFPKEENPKVTSIAQPATFKRFVSEKEFEDILLWEPVEAPTCVQTHKPNIIDIESRRDSEEPQTVDIKDAETGKIIRCSTTPRKRIYKIFDRSDQHHNKNNDNDCDGDMVMLEDSKTYQDGMNGYEDDGFVVPDSYDPYQKIDKMEETPIRHHNNHHNNHHNDNNNKPRYTCKNAGQSIEQSLQGLLAHESELDESYRKSLRREPTEFPKVTKYQSSLLLPDGAWIECDSELLVNRIPEFLLVIPVNTDTRVLEYTPQGMEFSQFFESKRSKWSETPFYRKLYERIIRPSVSIGGDKRSLQCREFLTLVMSNRLSVKPMQTIEWGGVCGGCGTAHRHCSYIATALDARGNEDHTKTWKLGRFCAKRLLGIINLFNLLNVIWLLPTSSKVIIANSFLAVCAAEERCLDSIQNGNSMWGKEDY